MFQSGSNLPSAHCNVTPMLCPGSAADSCRADLSGIASSLCDTQTSNNKVSYSLQPLTSSARCCQLMQDIKPASAIFFFAHTCSTLTCKTFCLQDLDPTAPLDSRVDDLLDLDEESLREMLSPGSLEEVRTKHRICIDLCKGSASTCNLVLTLSGKSSGQHSPLQMQAATLAETEDTGSCKKPRYLESMPSGDSQSSGESPCHSLAPCHLKRECDRE